MSSVAPGNAGREFFIDGSLLADDSGGWRNLGDWSATIHYREAAEALAVRVGMAADLKNGMSVLDLACGYGASLLLWQRKFGVTYVACLELQGACIQAMQALSAPTCTIAQGRFDQLPLPEPLTQTPFDAVVCIDAAYHARSLRALAAVANSALRDGGRIAFTTLAINEKRDALPLGLSLALRGAGIHRASLLTATGITSTLEREGFQNISVEPIGESVLAGFAHYVTHREQALSWRQRISPGWLKIKATGRLCDYLAKSGHLNYVLVHADLLRGPLGLSS